jgi:membrane-associated phospholipid phosphatase
MAGPRCLAVAVLFVAGASAAQVPHPEPRWPRDGIHVATGAALVAGAELLRIEVRPVPAQGFDRADIRWSVDRDQIGRLDSRAVPASDLASGISIAYPMLLAFATQPAGERASGTLRRGVIHLEAYLLATAASRWLKGALDRPRPYTYLAAAERPGEATYDVTDDEAFESMPSGHASASFCGAAFAMTDHLLTRPRAQAIERIGVAFGGGLLAGVTSALRVRAGKHFPSDVLAGGAIGVTSGIVVPLSHRYFSAERHAPLPSRRAWLEAIAGMVAGVGAGILVVEAAY